MLSKCANPACSGQFMHLHQGKIFYLSPTPEVEAAVPVFPPSLSERFWLCDECSKKLTLVWGGTGVKLVPLPEEKIVKISPSQTAKEGNEKERESRDWVAAN